MRRSDWSFLGSFAVAGHRTHAYSVYRELQEQHVLVERADYDVERRLRSIAGGGTYSSTIAWIGAGVCLARIALHEVASSGDCPKQEYFLSVLYLIVGDAVRTQYRTRSREDVERLLAEAGQKSPAYWVHLWVRRARALIAGQQAFRCDDWCGGVLARDHDA